MVINSAVFLYFVVLTIGVLDMFTGITDLLESNGMRLKSSLIVSAVITMFVIYALTICFVPFIQSFAWLL